MAENESAKGSFGSSPRTRRAIAIGAGAALILAAVAWYHFSGQESTDDAQVEGHVNPVAARVAGTVVEVLVADNQRVEKGTPLVRIDRKDYEVAVARAEADLAENEAEAKAASTAVPVASTSTTSHETAASSDLEGAEARRAAAAARLREAEARDAKATQDLERLKPLIEKDEVSRQEYDAAATTADAAHAMRDSARAEVRQAEKGIEAARARLESAQTGPEEVKIQRARAASAAAKADQMRAALDQARLNLQYTEVKAPVDRRREPPHGRDRPGGPGGTAASGHRAARRRLGRGQLQGRPVEAHPPRPARVDLGGRVRRQGLQGPRRQRVAGHRIALQPASPRERDGQLREGRPAGPREDRLRRQRGPTASAAPGDVGRAHGLHAMSAASADVVTISREYGSGGAAVAAILATRLGYQLLDRALILKIAKAAGVAPGVAELFDERVDPWLHRLGRALWHGGIEGVAQVDESQVVDADRLAALGRRVVEEAGQIGGCVIVGHGAQCTLARARTSFMYSSTPRGACGRAICAIAWARKRTSRPPWTRRTGSAPPICAATSTPTGRTRCSTT